MTIIEQKNELKELETKLIEHRKNCKQCHLPVRDEFEEEANRCYHNEDLQEDCQRLLNRIESAETSFKKELQSRGYCLKSNKIVLLNVDAEKK